MKSLIKRKYYNSLTNKGLIEQVIIFLLLQKALNNNCKLFFKELSLR